jgi:hypothetical protein
MPVPGLRGATKAGVTTAYSGAVERVPPVSSKITRLAVMATDSEDSARFVIVEAEDGPPSGAFRA